MNPLTTSFAPAAAGARTASIQVASSGSFPPALALTGTGLGGPLNLFPHPIS